MALLLSQLPPACWLSSKHSLVDDLQGGIAGNSILKGVLKVGQEIEVRPVIISKDRQGKFMCKAIFSKIG